MRRLSIPDVERKERRSDLVIRVVIPAGVALLFIGVLLLERDEPRYDLQISAPRSARPGATIGFRGTLIDQGDPVLALRDELPVSVELRQGERVLARTEATRSRAQGFEGTLRVPSTTAPSELLIVARAALAEQSAIVMRPLVVHPEPNPLEVRGRLQTELQTYSLGRMEERAEGDWHLDLRIVGGACQPELSCEALIWVGRPGASVAIVLAEGVALTAADSECGVLPRDYLDEPTTPPPSPATDGVLRCPLLVRGNEAVAHLVAHREGVVVARRSVRLPVMLGAVTVSSAPTATPGATPTLRIDRILSDEAYVVDLFHEDEWVTAFSGVDTEVTTPTPLATAGLWRVQTRRDIYSEPGGQRLLMVVGEQPLTAIARHPYQERWLDPMARDEILEAECNSPTCARERLASFMLAAGELEVVDLPNPTSGALQDQEGSHGGARGIRRRVAALLVLVAGIVVAVIIVRRGRRAGAEASSVLSAAGTAEPEVRRDRQRNALSLYGSAFFVVAVFLVVSAMILARGCL